MFMESNLPVTMPALALRGLTVFPNMLLHFDVGREASIKALDEAMTTGQPVFLVAQRDLSVESPKLNARGQRAGDGGGGQPGADAQPAPNQSLSDGGGGGDPARGTGEALRPD